MTDVPTNLTPATESNAAADPAIVAFVKSLRERDERGALALLRGALSTSEERRARALHLLAPFGGIPAGTYRERQEAEIVRVIAGLMTLPRLRTESTGENFGHACRRLLGEEERKSLRKPEALGPVARRVQHLLAATSDEVLERVCALAHRLANEDGNIDFAVLFQDLRRWNSQTKARWAASFWGAGREETGTEEDAAA